MKRSSGLRWKSRPRGRQHGDTDRLKVLTEKLANVLGGHFRYEEEQLAKVGYPKLDEHKAEHKVMLDELQLIRDRLDKMGHGTAQLAPGFMVRNYVLGVTVGHICHSDMEYCVFARKAAAMAARKSGRPPDRPSLQGR